MYSISVVLPTYNPNPERLRQTLVGLQGQSLDRSQWELLVVDNRSSPSLTSTGLSSYFDGELRVIREDRQGLSFARQTGILSAQSELIVFCDDDNVLAPSYLEEAIDRFAEHPRIGVAGGKCLPKFEASVPPWFRSDMAPLGLVDHGDMGLMFTSEEFQRNRRYPEFAPIGAGMAFRRDAVATWLATVGRTAVSDRKGSDLSSAGDCDIVLHALSSEWGVAYWPTLSLTHLIPANRVTRDYLGRVSRCAYRDFLIVLGAHGICPWSGIGRWTLPVRRLKAWIKCRAWQGPANWIRYQSAVGQLEGRVALAERGSILVQ